MNTCHAPHELRTAALKAFAALLQWELGAPEPTVALSVRVPSARPWEIKLEHRQLPISHVLLRVRHCSDIMPMTTLVRLWDAGFKPEDRTYAACSQAVIHHISEHNYEHEFPGWSRMSEAERVATVEREWSVFA